MMSRACTSASNPEPLRRESTNHDPYPVIHEACPGAAAATSYAAVQQPSVSSAYTACPCVCLYSVAADTLVQVRLWAFHSLEALSSWWCSRSFESFPFQTALHTRLWLMCMPPTCAVGDVKPPGEPSDGMHAAPTKLLDSVAGLGVILTPRGRSCAGSPCPVCVTGL
jgi:hypothetical protein